jgi:hypothetical protein
MGQARTAYLELPGIRSSLNLETVLKTAVQEIGQHVGIGQVEII